MKIDEPAVSDLATEREKRETAPKASPPCRDCGAVDENTLVDGLWCLRCSEKRRLATDFAPEDGDLP